MDEKKSGEIPKDELLRRLDEMLAVNKEAFLDVAELLGKHAKLRAEAERLRGSVDAHFRDLEHKRTPPSGPPGKGKAGKKGGGGK